MGKLFGTFGVTQFPLDTNPLMVGGLTLGLATLFFLAALVSSRAIKAIEVRELVAD